MIRKSKLKKIINEEIKEILSNPPSHDFEKSDRKIINSQEKIELLKNEYIIVDRNIKKLEKKLSSNDGDIEQIKSILDKNKKLKSEIELQIKKLQ